MNYRRPNLEQIDIGKISLWDGVNVRTVDVERDLDDLSGNIKQNGLQYPLLVKRDGDSYRAFSGQRRLLACVKAGLDNIPCLVYDELETDRARVLSLSENLYRRDMDQTDKVRACKLLMSSHDGNMKDVAAALGVTTQTVRNYLGFDALPEGTKELVRHKHVSAAQATKIASKLPRETAEEVTRELANIPKTERKQRQKLFTAAADARQTDSVDDIRKRAKRAEDSVEYRLLLPAEQSEILDRVAAAEHMHREDVASEFLVERIEQFESGQLRGEWHG